MRKRKLKCGVENYKTWRRVQGMSVNEDKEEQEKVLN